MVGIFFAIVMLKNYYAERKNQCFGRKYISTYKKIFVQSEINYCLKFKNPGPHFAGKFAIKEAMKKSLDESIDFLDIITKHKNLKPTVNLKINNSYVFYASVSHEKDYAIAIVISQ